MESNPQMTEVIFAAIDEINLQLSAEKRLEKSLDTLLSGRASKLDSLGLVNLILITEENIEDSLGITVNIADQRAMAQEYNPYRTVGSLSQYISQLCSEASKDEHDAYNAYQF